MHGTLRGPGAEAAQAIIEAALVMSNEQAVHLSRVYEADPNEHYAAHCTIVMDALAMTDRQVRLGWFESVFRYQEWMFTTKALHAIADAVMAVLVSDVVAPDVATALCRPWRSGCPLVTISPVEFASRG